MGSPAEKPSETLAALDERAREQRQRLLGQVKLAQNRLRPANLAHEAGNRVLDLGLDTIEKGRTLVRANPVKTAAAAAVVAAAAGSLMARKPLLKLLATGYMRLLKGSNKSRTGATDTEPQAETSEE